MSEASSGGVFDDMVRAKDLTGKLPAFIFIMVILISVARAASTYIPSFYEFAFSLQDSGIVLPRALLMSALWVEHLKLAPAALLSAQYLIIHAWFQAHLEGKAALAFPLSRRILQFTLLTAYFWVLVYAASKIMASPQLLAGLLVGIFASSLTPLLLLGAFALLTTFMAPSMYLLCEAPLTAFARTFRTTTTAFGYWLATILSLWLFSIVVTLVSAPFVQMAGGSIVGHGITTLVSGAALVTSTLFYAQRCHRKLNEATTPETSA